VGAAAAQPALGQQHQACDLPEYCSLCPSPVTADSSAVMLRARARSVSICRRRMRVSGCDISHAERCKFASSVAVRQTVNTNKQASKWACMRHKCMCHVRVHVPRHQMGQQSRCSRGRQGSPLGETTASSRTCPTVRAAARRANPPGQSASGLRSAGSAT